MPHTERSDLLAGLRVAVTRARSGPGDDPLLALIRELGATPLHYPLTEFLPPLDPEPLRAAAARILEYDWLIVTSARAIAPVVEAIREGGHSISSVRRRPVRICAVGSGTARALSKCGLPPDMTPDHYHSEGVIDAFVSSGPVSGLRILMPRAQEGRDTIPNGLASMGARVEVTPAYRSLERPETARELVRAVSLGEIDVLTFTAASGARSFGRAWREYCTSMDRTAARADALPRNLGVLALGPPTARALEVEGMPVHRVADPHTFAGLAAAVERWGRFRRQGDQTDSEGTGL